MIKPEKQYDKSISHYSVNKLIFANYLLIFVEQISSYSPSIVI